MKISRSALLPYSAMKMYQVVADIASYPAFLNWCDSAEIISADRNEVVAQLGVSYTRLNMQFTTRNQNIPGVSIDMVLEDGPFSELKGRWLFQTLSEDACKVSLDMNFDFDRSLTKQIVAKVFAGLVSSQIDAFQQRAEALYNAEAFHNAEAPHNATGPHNTAALRNSNET